MPISGPDSGSRHDRGETPRLLKLVAGVLSLGLVLVSAAGAQQGFGQGQQLYLQHCALCHRDSGVGDPPRFPALSGNDRLGDPVRLVRSIHQGRRRMPPFPGLTAEEISSLANYVGNRWAKDFRGVTPDEVAAALVGLQETGPMVSVWEGVFTEAQAQRGQAVYEGACGTCHGSRLNGAPDDPDMRSSPPVARARFLRVWEGLSLGTLLAYTRATMPEENPNSLTQREYVDVIAYQLSVSGMPMGEDELQTDPYGLAHVVIQPQP